MKLEELVITEYRNVVRIRDREGRRLRVHDRPYSSVILPLTGKIRFTFEDRCVQCGREQAILIPQGSAYLNECLEEADSLVFSFSSQTPLDGPMALPHRDRARALEQFQRMERLSVCPAAEARLKGLGETYQLLAWLTADGESRGAARLLDRAVTLLLDNCGNPAFRLRTAAESLSISEAYLRRLFQREYRLSPGQYLKKIRMERARDCLAEGATVTETALRVGYSDVYQFSRAYSRYYGCAPSQSRLPSG